MYTLEKKLAILNSKHSKVPALLRNTCCDKSQTLLKEREDFIEEKVTESKIKLQFYIDESEKEMLKKQMAIIHFNNFGSFARKISLDDLIIEANLNSFK